MSSTKDCVDCQNESAVADQAVDAPGKEIVPEVPAKSDVALDPLNPATFVPPNPLPTPSITIEYCDRCRWQHRATWVSTELMLTFPTPTIKAITLLPLNSEETGGRFRVWLTQSEQPPTLIWDRKVEGGFPELRLLKQRIRDNVQPGKSLGHSDKKHETAS